MNEYKCAKEIIAKDENETQKVYYIAKPAFAKLMLEIKIDVGASNRFSVKEQLRTLENLLTAGYITFDMFLQLIPDGTYLPVKKLQDLIE